MRFSRLLAIGMLCGLLSAANAATSFGPTPYLEEGDAPADFYCDLCPIHLEDFEDNVLDPFLTIDNGSILLPNATSGTNVPVTDSVDGDDGSVDGTGISGHSWFTGAEGIVDRTLSITFDATVTSAGFVFTDGDPLSTSFMLEAFDDMGNSIGILDAGDLADDEYTGQTAEDRFLGFQDYDGIAKLTLTMDAGQGIEIDHIQWQNCAQCVPEPATFGVLGFALIGLLGFRRR